LDMENIVKIPKSEYEHLKNCEVFVETVKKTLFGDYQPRLNDAFGEAGNGGKLNDAYGKQTEEEA
jgi:hypothetical protein